MNYPFKLFLTPQRSVFQWKTRHAMLLSKHSLAKWGWLPVWWRTAPTGHMHLQWQWAGTVILWAMKSLSAAFLCMLSSTHIPNPCQLFLVLRCSTSHCVHEWSLSSLNLACFSTGTTPWYSSTLSYSLSITVYLFLLLAQKCREQFWKSDPSRTLLLTHPHFDVKCKLFMLIAIWKPLF